MQCKAYKIKIAYAVAAFKPEKRNVFLTHYFLKILAWGKNALAPNIIAFVKLGIEYFYPQMRHSYFICIRKAEGKSHVHLVFVLYNAVYLAARVSAGLLHRKQQSFKFFIVHFLSPFFKIPQRN